MGLKLGNKKGIFFTLLVIFLLFLFLVSYSLYSIVQERKAVEKRINSLNNFVFSVEENIPRNLYIAGFRTIFLLEKNIAETGTYATNLNSSFEGAFFNGTLYSQEQELMNGAKFSDIENLITQQADKINAEVFFYNPKLIITQEDSWHVKLILETDLLIKDKGNLVLWNKTASFSSYVPIQGFEDPLYLINTNGKIVNKINKTIYTEFVSGSQVSNLLNHVENSYYIASQTSPSFLDRLQGINSPNENGIESLVYLPKLSSQGIIVQDKSAVDYIYFSSDNPQSYHILGMPSWFKLDSGHLEIYQVQNLIS